MRIRSVPRSRIEPLGSEEGREARSESRVPFLSAAAFPPAKYSKANRYRPTDSELTDALIASPLGK
ncbi:hypothetical protein D3H35_26195 [Cohnella faecalis]|uniref:Uncharacterized protein n=1 Tax=Cohnella faecalis TaxID=2315694 RepID=A0A398CDB9_9BACL|nr:hypothetical protein D3H35_26195 [Cohnella faecalis]